MKILAASWGGGDRTQALRMAATLSKEMGAELHVAHIWTWLLPGAPEFIEPKHCKRQEEDAQQFVEASVRMVEAAGGIVAETHIRPGFPESEIIRLSGEIAADMVIVSKQRRGIIKRLLSDCKAERVARYATCPVVLVGQEVQENPLVSMDRESTF